MTSCRSQRMRRRDPAMVAWPTATTSSAQDRWGWVHFGMTPGPLRRSKDFARID